MKQKVKTILLKIETYTQTDMLYLAKGGFWLLLGNIIGIILSTISTIFFANYLNQHTYGIYKYILSIAGLVSFFSLRGINSALTQSISKKYYSSFITAFKTKFKWGLLGSLSIFIISIYYYIQGNLELSKAFIPIIFLLPIVYSTNIYACYLVGIKNFKKNTIFNIINKFATIIPPLITLIFTQNIFLIIFISFFSQALMGCIFYIKITKNIKITKHKDTEFINYGKHLTLANIFSKIANQIDKILVFQLLGPTELAIYMFAITPPEQIKLFAQIFSTLAFPKFSKTNKKILQQTLFKKILIFTIILSIITFIYILLSPLIFKFIFPQYTESLRYSQIFSITIIGTSLLLTFTALKAQKQTNEIYIFNILTGIIQIILILLLLPTFKLWGIIIARIFSRFFDLILINYLFFKK